VFFCFIYFLVIPLWVFNLLLRFKHDDDPQVHKKRLCSKTGIQHLTFLTQPFRKKYYWWSAIDLLKRLAFTASGSFLKSFEDSNSVSYYTTVVFLFIFLMIDITFMPYSDEISLRVSLLWNSVALVILVSDALIFKVASVSALAKLALAILLILCVCVSCLTVLFEKLPCFMKRSYVDLEDLNTDVTFSDPVDEKSSGVMSISLTLPFARYRVVKGEYVNRKGTLISSSLVLASPKPKNTNSFTWFPQESQIEVSPGVSAMQGVEVSSVAQLSPDFNASLEERHDDIKMPENGLYSEDD
jgi:hypothetical protein